MNIGEKFLNTGNLTYKRNLRKYKYLLKLNYETTWFCNSNIFDSPCSEEEVILATTLKSNYKSLLHYAFRYLAYKREIDNKFDLLELCSEYQNEHIDTDAAILNIKKTVFEWWKKNSNLLLNYSSVTVIWDDGTDLCYVFENEDEYLLWNWNTTA